ncbi:MAG: hypothetical protein SWC96_09005 [Thermodesulfobacteriota bacterium]|nr:hypothetical protein [Thermodesulfobacteriota bacterium]
MNRGGGWNNNAQNCRSANRNRNEPDNRNNNLGFRLVCLSVRRTGADAPSAGPDTAPSPSFYMGGANTETSCRGL